MTGVALLYMAVAVPYTAFVLLYGFRSPWWATGMGRSLLLSKAVIAALAINAVLALYFGEYPGRDLVRAFVVGGAIIAGWSQLILLVLEQRRDRRCPNPDSEESL